MTQEPKKSSKPQTSGQGKKVVNKTSSAAILAMSAAMAKVASETNDKDLAKQAEDLKAKAG